MPVCVTLDDAEHPLLGDHSLANQCGSRLPLFGRHVGRQGVLGASAGTQRAQAVWHLPDAILISDQDSAVAPREPIWAIEALGMTLNPVSLSVAVFVTQEC
jgi:hypothetical protein